MPPITTHVIHTKAKHNRSAYMTIMNNQVHFDCSDGEYGSITVSLDQLEEAIYEHKNKLKNENKTATQSRRD
jgi:flagellar biosynthesis chaperone FliJ